MHESERERKRKIKYQSLFLSHPLRLPSGRIHCGEVNAKTKKYLWFNFTKAMKHELRTKSQRKKKYEQVQRMEKPTTYMGNIQPKKQMVDIQLRKKHQRVVFFSSFIIVLVFRMG